MRKEVGKKLLVSRKDDQKNVTASVFKFPSQWHLQDDIIRVISLVITFFDEQLLSDGAALITSNVSAFMFKCH